MSNIPSRDQFLFTESFESLMNSNKNIDMTGGRNKPSPGDGLLLLPPVISIFILEFINDSNDSVNKNCSLEGMLDILIILYINIFIIKINYKY